MAELHTVTLMDMGTPTIQLSLTKAIKRSHYLNAKSPMKNNLLAEMDTQLYLRVINGLFLEVIDIICPTMIPMF
jgi:hypothetical protein